MQPLSGFLYYYLPVHNVMLIFYSELLWGNLYEKLIHLCVSVCVGGGGGVCGGV